MPNIVLSRVDNRLIHGQVATNWLKNYAANFCIVVNDRVAPVSYTHLGDTQRRSKVAFDQGRYSDDGRRGVYNCAAAGAFGAGS